MVALLAGRLRCLAIDGLQPGKHRLADMDAAVIDQCHLHDIVSAGLQQPGNGVSQEIVPDMAEVKRLVGVR